jgi:TolB-like protein
MFQNVSKLGSDQAMTTIHQLGPFRLDKMGEILFRGAEPVSLGQRAVALLRVLVERAGAPVSKNALIEAAWPGLAVEEGNLTVQIAALRRVFEEVPGGESWIETLPRRGYRYVGPVMAIEDKGLAAATMMRPASQLALPNKSSIAVLPFDNMSSVPEQDYFCDGMVEDIITGLSRIRWLFVIARNSSFIYQGRSVDIKQIGRELGVRYVLQGSVRKATNRVRITAQLVEADSGAHLWAERYDRPLDDIFAVQDEITMCVVGAIEPSLRRVEIERVKRQRPNNLNAYDLVLRSLPFVFTRLPTDAARAISLLEDALKLEPNYGAAHAFLSWCIHARFRRGGLHLDDRIAALHHAHAAIVHGNDDATALAAAAFVIVMDEHDTATALKLFERALELSNSNVFALSCSALTLGFLGKTELAIERAQQALRLSPFDSWNHFPHAALAISYFHTKRYEDAVDAAQSGVNSNPGFSAVRAFLTAALVRLERMDDAKAAAREILECEPSWTIRRAKDIFGVVPAVFGPFAQAWREVGLPDDRRPEPRQCVHPIRQSTSALGP